METNRVAVNRRRMTSGLRVAISGAICMMGLGGARPALADDLATIGQRVTAQLLSSSPSASTVQGYMSSLQANGSWADVNYASTAATNWSPLTHLQRMEAMAQLYNNPKSSLYQNTTLATNLSSAMNYWIATNAQSTNWFDNDIAGPQALGAAMVLAKPVFSSSQLASGQTILGRAKSVIPQYTGQNVVDLSIAGVYSAIVSGSTADMNGAFGSMNGTVFVSKFGTDGIQADSTYHIHDIQLYMGGYGTSYINDMLNWASISAGTSYALSDTQQHTIVNYLLDGTQWFIRGRTLDLAADGRQVTFPTYVGAGDGYVGAIQNALALGNYRTSELQAFLARQQAIVQSGSASSTQNTLTGNRAFFDSDAMVQQRGILRIGQSHLDAHQRPRERQRTGLEESVPRRRRESDHGHRERIPGHSTGLELVSPAGHDRRTGWSVAQAGVGLGRRARHDRVCRWSLRREVRRGGVQLQPV